MENQNMTNLYEELLKYTQFITPERMTELQILPTDSKAICIYKMLTIIREFSDGDYMLYKYMVNVFEVLPKKFRMEIILGVLLKKFKLNYDFCLQLLDRHLKDETAEEREERIKKNEELLSNKINEDGTISCYTKVSMGDISPVWRYEFNTSQNQVMDSLYFKECGVSIQIAGGYTRNIRIEDVLFCGENNNVYLIPEGYIIENGLADDIEDWIVDLDLYVSQDNFEMNAGIFDDDIDFL